MSTGEIVALGSLAVLVVGHIALTAFYFGKLSQRVASLEKESEGMAGVSEKVTRLEVQMDTAIKTLEKLDTHMVGAQRQLANIAARHFETEQVPRGRSRRSGQEPDA